MVELLAGVSDIQLRELGIQALHDAKLETGATFARHGELGRSLLRLLAAAKATSLTEVQLDGLKAALHSHSTYPQLLPIEMFLDWLVRAGFALAHGAPANGFPLNYIVTEPGARFLAREEGDHPLLPGAVERLRARCPGLPALVLERRRRSHGHVSSVVGRRHDVGLGPRSSKRRTVDARGWYHHVLPRHGDGRLQPPCGHDGARWPAANDDGHLRPLRDLRRPRDRRQLQECTLQQRHVGERAKRSNVWDVQDAFVHRSCRGLLLHEGGGLRGALLPPLLRAVVRRGTDSSTVVLASLLRRPLDQLRHHLRERFPRSPRRTTREGPGTVSFPPCSWSGSCQLGLSSRRLRRIRDLRLRRG